MKTHFLKLLCLTGLLTACLEQTDALQDISNNTETIVTEPRQIGSSKASVDESEAKNVAALFTSKKAKTRSNNLEIGSVQTITDKQSRTLMYAINFANDNGYVLVSATKKYDAILAYAEQGHFDATLNGVNVWLEDEKNMMQFCLDDTAAAYNIQWLEYIDRKEQSAKHPTTRVESAYPEDINWWWMEVANELTYPDYHSDFEDGHAASGELINNWCCHVDEARNFLPDCSSTYNEMDELCRIYGYTEQDVIYHIREFYSETIVNPLLITNWTQGWPYNWKVEKSLGCVTIATAQIMYHHRKPAYYNWDRININNDETEEQGSYFKELGEKLGIDYNTNEAGSDITAAKRVLQNYGYTVNKKDDYTSDKLYSALKANQPIYMRGRTHQILGFDAGSGHAWICDGYRKTHSTYVLTVYAPFGSHPDSKGLYAKDPYFPQYGYDGSTGFSITYNHMNWGWGGNQNSWNRDGDYKATNGETYHRNTEFLFVEP